MVRRWGAAAKGACGILPDVTGRRCCRSVTTPAVDVVHRSACLMRTCTHRQPSRGLDARAYLLAQPTEAPEEKGAAHNDRRRRAPQPRADLIPQQNVGRDELHCVQDVEEAGEGQAVQVAADVRADRRADRYDGRRHGDQGPGDDGVAALHVLPPQEPDDGVRGHEDDRCRRGRALRHAEQQREQRERADVEAAAADGGVHAAEDADAEQGERRPQLEAGVPDRRRGAVQEAGEGARALADAVPRDGLQRHALVVAVCEVEREGEGEPHGHEGDLLDDGRHDRRNVLQAEDHAHGAANAGVQDRALLVFDAHEDNVEGGGGHPHALDYEAEVSGVNGRYLESEAQHRKCYGCRPLRWCSVSTSKGHVGFVPGLTGA